MPPISQPENFSFGPFQFDPVSGRLAKHGHRIKLQPKAASVLLSLLENAGSVVRREQLQKALWPEGTYVDFDLGIKTAVKKLREALGDSADEPVYVQTVYGEGFRFIAPVIRAGGRPDAPPPAPPSEPGPPARRTSRVAVALAALVVLSAVILNSSGPPANRLRFQNRDWVVIAVFENRTGEAVLDGSMEYAVANELARSAYVNVAPPERVADTLKLMRQSPSARLTEDQARQVAVRDGGIKAVIAGRVDRFGSNYLLTVRLVHPASGQTAAVVSKESLKEQLPAAARSVAQELRRKLGEQDVKVDGAPEPLERATTPSLTALHTFSSAMTLVNSAKWPQAAELMEEATRQDPQFALAHIYAAHSYSNVNQEDRAAPHYKAAFELAGSVSERERLFILGSYYQRFVRDYRRALAIYQALLQQYPDDYWGLNNSLSAYYPSGMFLGKEAMETRERLLALRPNRPQRWQFMLELWWYYKRQHPDERKARFYRTQLDRWRGSDAPPSQSEAFVLDAILEVEPAMEQWFAGNVRAAADALALVTSKAMTRGDDAFAGNIAAANLALGKIRVARSLCERQRSPRLRSSCLLTIAYVAGDRKTGKQLLLELRDVHNGYGDLEIVLATMFGETGLARKWATNRPDDLIPIVTGHPEAIKPPWGGLGQDPWGGRGHSGWRDLWYRMMSADALEKQGKAEEAVAVLSQETRPAQLDLAVAWNWPQCRMKLAELLRRHGRVEEAIEVENEIRHFLAAADPDYPVMAHLRSLSTIQVGRTR